MTTEEIFEAVDLPLCAYESLGNYKTKEDGSPFIPKFRITKSELIELAAHMQNTFCMTGKIDFKGEQYPLVHKLNGVELEVVGDPI